MRVLLRSSLAATVILTGVAMAQRQRTTEQELRRMVQDADALVSVAAEDLHTGRRILIADREMHHAASTMKTPVMIEVFRQVQAGVVRLDSAVTVRNAFRSIVDGSEFTMDMGDDSDDAIYRRLGQDVSVRALVEQMITVSSNFATNMLIDLVGAANVTATMRHLGASDIQVLRGVEDIKAFRQGMNNRTNAYDLMMIYRSIARGEAVDSAASSAMLGVLLRQRFRDKIPAMLPEGVRVAHKTGNITGVEHDSGIVIRPDGSRFVLVLLSSGWKDQSAARPYLARLSRAVYDIFDGDR